MADEAIRCFIAIELPADLVKQLKDFQAALKLTGTRVAKWVEPGSMHLTLKFLGDVHVKRLPAVKDEAGIAVKSLRPFNLVTGRTGFFPDNRRPRVFWLGLDGDTEALVKLHNSIDQSMSKLGFARENRPFTGHLTLARLREESSIEERTEFARRVEVKAFQPPCKIEVQSVVLMRSQLTPRRAIYTRLDEFSLAGGTGID